MDNGACSTLEITADDKLRYFPVGRSQFHLAGNIYGSPKKYNSTCYSLTYKETGGANSGKVVAILPAVIFNCNILSAANVHSEINLAYMKYNVN